MRTMFAPEFRVCLIKRGHLLVAPIDGAGTINVWVPSPQRYIENEIVILGSLEKRQGGFKGQIIASRTDPSFLKVRPFEVLQIAEDQYELEEYPSADQAEAFEEALEIYRAECFDEAGAALREFLSRFPLHIDSYHHLGNIEWKEGHLSRALKYYEMGHRIGLLCLPDDFTGCLSWSNSGNRPFLRATHAYALLLNRKKRLLEACKVSEQLLVWDPGDRLGIRDLLPRYYFEANAPELARTFLESRKTGGTNHYTLGLLRLMEGRRREALRSLCAAVVYNPYVILFLLGERRVPDIDIEAEYVTMGGENEAAEYLLDFAKYWRRDRSVDFLRLIMRPGSPFRRRFDRFLHIKEQLDEVRDFPMREQLIAEKQKILNEDDVRALLREASDSIFS